VGGGRILRFRTAMVVVISRLVGQTGPVLLAKTLSGRGSGQRKTMTYLYINPPITEGGADGGLLGGVSALQETDLTGPVSIYNLLP